MRDILKKIRTAVTDTADTISEANHWLALTNRLKAVERSEEAKAQRMYMALGRYLAEHMPEDAPEDVRARGAEAQKTEEKLAAVRGHLATLQGRWKTEEDKAFKNSASPEAREAFDKWYADTVGAEEKAPVSEEETPAEEAEEAAEPAVLEPQTECEEEEMSEEAAEDENDSIPFI